MPESKLKELLVKCELLLEEGDFEALNATLKEILAMDFSSLNGKDFEEAVRIIDFLLSKAEDKKQDIAQKLVNFQKFKGYIK